MTSEAIKSQINRLIDSLPQGALLQVLYYIKELQKQQETKFSRNAHIALILKEDIELLKRLAE